MKYKNIIIILGGFITEIFTVTLLLGLSIIMSDRESI